MKLYHGTEEHFEDFKLPYEVSDMNIMARRCIFHRITTLPNIMGPES